MTLFKQIKSLLFFLFLLLMSTLVYFQFTQTVTFMDTQIESDLNNTAHALTLMLQPHLETGDTVTAETVINVIFEGGFYKKVTLIWLSNQESQIWENPIQVDGVPQWFLALNLFKQQSVENTITNGWMQLATIHIEANPAIGYRQLWQVMSETLLVLGTLFLFALCVLHIRLKSILRPLHFVAEKAQLIAKRDFQPDLALPQTTELKEVVLAMNSMSSQLKVVFSQLDKEVIHLKHETLTDKISSLPNRLFLNAHLESWLTEPGYGGLMIAKLDWLGVIHHELGYQARDNTIHILAKELQSTLPSIAPSVIARISHNEFAFLVTKASPEKLQRYLHNTIRILTEGMNSVNSSTELIFAIGGASRSVDISAQQLLSNADRALQHAFSAQQKWHWHEGEKEVEGDLVRWDNTLNEAIQGKHFLLQWHPVLSFDNKHIVHYEIYCRLKMNGKVVRAAKFMPNMEILGLGRQFDQQLIETLIAHAEITKSTTPIAINITQESVIDETFHYWLKDIIQSQKVRSHFHFEIRECTILAFPEFSQQFAKVIKGSGAKLGIDNFGRKMGSLSYIQSIQPDYVKLDHSLSCRASNDIEMDDLQQRLKLTRAVINTARGSDIEVYITAVEDASQLKAVSVLHATGYQGFITAPIDLR